MNALKTHAAWIGWLLLTFTMTGYLSHRMRGPDRSLFLPGPTTHGHYQIELACNACHTPMMGVREESCTDCHGADLKAANDSHPKSKFTDPRNADRVARLDARNCVTCHREHRPELTRAMGVTLPDDYCSFCHQSIGKERPSHADFGYETCASAGCHNYHDNTALYEDFLAKHLDDPELKSPARVPVSAESESPSTAHWTAPPLTPADHDAPANVSIEPHVLDEWSATRHAAAGVNCTDCHSADADTPTSGDWTDHPTHTACSRCHDAEVSGFLAGKHGMRLARELPPMRPALARLPMNHDALDRELNCQSCHAAHRYDTRTAAVDSCLACHDDAHSRAYRDSPHFALWRAELAGHAPPGSGVSCATCHLPRAFHRIDGHEILRVEHNQNHNLQPNEKMIRSVCLHCHGLGFAIDALADVNLILNNFNGPPAVHIPSLELVGRRRLETQTRNPTPEESPNEN
ncbi:MAG TPA: cytochrome c3 family protein [Methylomirabilota bacterium]|nr:cytochrome c3 family protein [Methylomirabilota bacterium]